MLPRPKAHIGIVSRWFARFLPTNGNEHNAASQELGITKDFLILEFGIPDFSRFKFVEGTRHT
jgi:hypothetical protein